MKKDNKLYSVKILKSGVFFIKTNSKFFADYKVEYYLDFKEKLNLKQFKIGSSK